jgi:rubrerythrin
MAHDVKRYAENLRDELNGAELYKAIAAAEDDPVRKDLFLQLAQAEAKHAQLWRDKLVAVGVEPEPFRPSFKTRLRTNLLGGAQDIDALVAFMASHQSPNSPYARGMHPDDKGTPRIHRVGGKSCPTGADVNP